MSGHHGDDRNAFNAAKVRWFETMLEDIGLLGPGEVDDFLTAYREQSKPENGARLVARAWLDPMFRTRLLEDATGAARELLPHIDAELAEPNLIVVENTETTRNVLVCTLCSCYPIWLLGPSPSWYKSVWYRSRVVREPRAVLAEFGQHVPSDTTIEVWDSSSDMRYMVLPARPAGTEDLTEDELVALVTRNGLIGVADV